MGRELLLVISLQLLVASTVPASLPAQAARDTLGFWVVGRDASTRAWASEWMERALRASVDRPQLPILDWKSGLLRMLDVDPPGALEDPRRDGPSVGVEPSAKYPWDMRQEVSLSDMRDILHDLRLGAVVQVVVRRDALSFVSPRDSVYVLYAVAIAEQSIGAHSHALLLTAAHSRVIAHASLQVGTEMLATEIAAIWSDLAAVVRAPRAR